jgi:hypothetical protein
MSKKPPSKKPKVAQGESDGKYSGAHGPTDKFQAQWLEHPAPEGQPQRKDWLCDGGVDEKNWSGLPRLQSEQQQQLRMLTLLQQAAAMSQNLHSPLPSLSQGVLGGSHALRGTVSVWGVGYGSRVGDGNGARVSGG